MDPDLVLVIGIVLAVLALPAVLSALAERRRPGAGVLTAVAAGCLIVWAAQSKRGGYAFGEIPEVFVRVVARYLL